MKLVPLTAVFIAVLLSACGSTPASNYYLLTASEAIPQGSSPALGVGPITVPQYLNRNNLIYQRDGNALHIANYERWAEPLEDGISRVLSLNLAAELNTANVQSFPWHSETAPDYAIEINILSLEASQGQANLVAEWAVRSSAANKVVAQRISRIQEPLAGSGDQANQLPAAYSKLLARLSELIADSISAAEQDS